MRRQLFTCLPCDDEKNLAGIARCSSRDRATRSFSRGSLWRCSCLVWDDSRRAGDELAYAGFVNATDQEAIDGYFSVGDDAMVVVKQGTGLQSWLKAHSGQRIRITLEPDATRSARQRPLHSR